MEQLHQQADDVLAVRLTNGLASSSAALPLPPSRHALLREPLPPVAASSPPPTAQGLTLQLRVRDLPTAAEEAAGAACLPPASTLAPALASDWLLDPSAAGGSAAASSTSGNTTGSGGVRLWPARLQSWSSRDHADPHSVGLEWLGVELSNVAAPASASLLSSSLAPPRLQWRTQHYLVREGPPRDSPLAELAERALDSSLSLRFALRNQASVADALTQAGRSTTAPPSAAVSEALSAHLSAHVGVVTNLGAATKPRDGAPAAAPGAPSPLMLSGNVVVGYESPRAEIVPSAGSNTKSAALAQPRVLPAHHWSVQAFGSSDGGSWGGAAFKTFQWRGALVQDGDVASAFERLTGAAALWPQSWPRFQLCSSGLGLEYAWVKEAKDFTAGFGVQQRFRWLPSRADSGASVGAKAGGVALAVQPVAPSQPSTVSLSATAMGHLLATLLTPVSRRWSVAARAHGQLTNGETLLQLGTRLALNDAQSVGVSIDTRGGIKAALSTRRRPASTPSSNNRGVSSAFAWLGWLSRRAELQLHVQAYPLLPALLPAWNVRSSDVQGAWYSQEAALRLQKPQITWGASINIDFD